MKLTFLEASVPLVKSFSIGKNRQIEKHSYPHVRDFTSHTYDVRNITKFHELLTQHAKQGHCLLKGELSHDLTSQSRAGSTNPGATTDWLCLDVDGLPGVNTAEEFISLLPREFHNVSYIAQYSASMGIIDKGLSVHLIFMCNQEIRPLVLKQWLTRLNLDTPNMREHLTLTRTQNTLRWPLDITICQNDKLIYIAPPKLGRGVKDTFKGQRIELVKKRSNVLTYDFNNFNPGPLRQDVIKALNEKRKDAGLKPKRQLTEKVYKDVPVLTATTQAEVTGIKEDRGFTYLNLNGGDSWGYYHPTGNPDILYNFKGEPNYLIKELLPEYYAEQKAALKDQPKEKVDPVQRQGHTTYFAGIDTKSDNPFRGIYHHEEDELEFYPTSKRQHITDFFKQHGQIVPEHLDMWDVVFAYNEDFHVDFKARRINSYLKSDYLHGADPTQATKVPKIIDKVLHHALGNNDECYDHFLHWLGAIFQHRMKTGICWVLHGTQGTGKGIIYNNIITPLIGRDYAARTSLPTMASSSFNGYMENSVFCLIDEAQVSEIEHSEVLKMRIREYISEPQIPINQKNAREYLANNFTNFLIYSNTTEPVYIPSDDRRFSVAVRQNTKLHITKQEVESIEDELQAFADFLIHMEVDLNKATKPLINDARRRVQELTRDTNEEVAQRIMEGDLEFFFDNAPDIEVDGELMDKTHSLLPTYKEAIHEILINLDTGRVSRDAMQTLFFYTAGNIPMSKNKFTKFLAHKGIDTARIRINTNRQGKVEQKSMHGISDIKWSTPSELLAHINDWLGKTLAVGKNNVTPISRRTRRTR